jgi:SET domain-containing protein
MQADVVAVGPSTIHGTGVFALTTLRARRKIGELTGELIPLTEARWRARGQRCIQIVEFEDNSALDCSQGNAFRFVNHSCTPNAYLRRIHHRVEIYALRDIKPGEELTCNYGETQHGGTLPCACGSETCREKL